MAIVKFVSDKDCQVFIDMELAGKVSSESMLKVTLETGGYLIQVKDEDGNLIKEYDLEIKPSDNQLLHKIDGANNKLDDTIENLKNDSSLVFHCDRASFSHNGLYGFVDKKLNVVISPIYYSVNEFVDDKAFVVRDFPEGRKTTMIDSNGNMFFNRWYDYIGESDDTILLGIDNRIIVYSKTKCDKIAEYFNAGYDFNDSFVPVYTIDGKDKLYGYIDFSGKVVVPFIFSKIENFSIVNNISQVKVELFDIETCLVKKWFDKQDTIWGEEDIIELISDLLQDVYYGNNDYRWNISAVNRDGHLLIKIVIESVWDNSFHKEIFEEADRILHIKSGYAVCRYQNRIKVVVIDIENQDVICYFFESDDAIPIFREIYYNAATQLYPCAFIINNNDYYGIVDRDSNQIVPCEYEIIESYPSKDGEVYAILRKDGKSALCDILNKTMLTKFTYDNISLYESVTEMTFLLEKGGKYGLMKGTKLIPANYDKIIVGNHFNIIASRDTYGIIDDDNNIILPTDYQEISILEDKYIRVKNKNGYSLGCATDGKIYNEVFDRICLLENDYDSNSILDFVLVEKNGNQGCISLSKGEVKIPIEYDKIELVSINRHYPEIVSVCFLLYKDEKVGYCEFGYYYIETDFDIILGSSYKGPIEYLYTVKPDYEECILLANEYSVLSHYYMHYAAVRKGNKWGILDQKGRAITYQAMDLNLEDENTPNYTDLDFKYNSLDELKKDADKELKRRYDKNYHPWTIRRDMNGKDCIVEE